ncbi:hypothetical protein [Psychrobacter sp. 72-O-c]|uniref:hypothetical protein n=1 Tax=Psychrobacter sp. 72-O-c TaxID=2774125 RepID=UPI00191A5E5D|nr:hypothetical protein [Psychrobacter sp. 72-O-c]
MEMFLALKFWREIIIGALLALLLIVIAACIILFLQVKQANAEVEYIKTEHALTLTTERANYEVRARKLEKESYDQTIAAINDAKKREKSNAIDAANTVAANERLSQTIDRLSANAATDAQFRVEYATTSGQLLKDCSSSITDLARVADMHVNDIRMLQGIAKRK